MSLTEKLILLFLGVLVLPFLVGRAPYSFVGLTAGILCVAISSVVWLVLVLHGLRQEG